MVAFTLVMQYHSGPFSTNLEEVGLELYLTAQARVSCVGLLVLLANIHELSVPNRTYAVGSPGQRLITCI